MQNGWRPKNTLCEIKISEPKGKGEFCARTDPLWQKVNNFSLWTAILGAMLEHHVDNVHHVTAKTDERLALGLALGHFLLPIAQTNRTAGA